MNSNYIFPTYKDYIKKSLDSYLFAISCLQSGNWLRQIEYGQIEGANYLLKEEQVHTRQRLSLKCLKLVFPVLLYESVLKLVVKFFHRV